MDVRVTYLSRLPTGCSDSASECYPMCVHHNTPGGTQVVVPLWGADPVRLEQTPAGRYEGRRAHQKSAGPRPSPANVADKRASR